MGDSPLSERKCKPCEGGVKPYTRAEAQEALAEVPGWDLKDGKLEREFKFKDFDGTMGFVNAVAEVARLENHHPVMTVGYRTCRIAYWTHAILGLSENDFICAAKVSQFAGSV